MILKTLRPCLMTGVLALSILMTAGCAKKEEQAAPPVITPAASEAPAQSSPMGMRRFMNYNGHRYAFLENGMAYDLTEEHIKEKLGMLSLSIMEDPGANGSKDFATTFAEDGTVYSMTSYDPAFRIAVLSDDSYYICENVDTLDDSPVILTDYFKTAGFPETADSLSISDHMGREELKNISGKDMELLLEVLSRSEEAEFTDEEYQAMGKAQKNGESFYLSLNLKDGTAYRFYVIPSLGISMFGDNRYRLPEDFDKKCSGFFSDLEQKPLPAQ